MELEREVVKNRIRCQLWRQKNLEYARQYDRDRKLRNPQHIREINTAATRRYRKRFPDRYKWRCLVLSSRQRKMPILMECEDFCRWYREQEKRCEYCDLTDISLDVVFVNGKALTALTVDRKNNSLPYSLDNICLSCWQCNRIKGGFFTHDEFREIAQKYLKSKWQRRAEELNAA